MERWWRRGSFSDGRRMVTGAIVLIMLDFSEQDGGR
jgi:hypothetical protein